MDDTDDVCKRSSIDSVWLFRDFLLSSNNGISTTNLFIVD